MMQMKSKIRRLLHKRASCIVHPHTNIPSYRSRALMHVYARHAARQIEREREREEEEERRGEKAPTAWSAECMDVL